MVSQLRKLLPLLVVLAALFTSTGCASRDPQPIQRSRSTIERPARPVGEEQNLADRIGEVGVVLLVVGIALVLIAVPIFFLL